MKKVVYFLLALVLVGLEACDNGPKFKVQGEVSGAADKTLYFEASGLEGIVVLDSVELGSDGCFDFAQARPEAPDFYRLRLEGKVINFSVDSTETVSVKATADKFDTAYEIGGSVSNQKIKELVLLQGELQNKVDKLTQNRDIPAGIAQQTLSALVNQFKDKVKKEYIFTAPNTTYAYFALFQIKRQLYIRRKANNFGMNTFRVGNFAHPVLFYKNRKPDPRCHQQHSDQNCQNVCI